MGVRTGIALAMAAIALGACGSNHIVFRGDEPDDAGVVNPVDVRPQPRTCPTVPYIPEAGVPSSMGQLDITAFPIGTGSFMLLARGGDGNLWFTNQVREEPRGTDLFRAAADGVFTDVRRAG